MATRPGHARPIRRVPAVVLAVLGFLATLAAAPAPVAAQSDSLVDELVATGLNQPVAADFLPDGRLLVTGRSGHLWRVDPGSGTVDLLTIISVDPSGDGGLLDVEVAPDFAATGHVYLGATVREGGDVFLRLMRIQIVGEFVTPPTVLWSARNPSSPEGLFHPGGAILVEGDTIWFTTGDAFLSPTRSRDLDSVWGKVLRLDLAGNARADNPFADGPGGNVDEIWATGFRNPFRIAPDDRSDGLLVGDVGGNVRSTAYEELNLVVRGADHGWSDCQGPPTRANGPDCPAGVTDPLWSYPHQPDNGAAIISGPVLDGGLGADRVGAVAVADFVNGWIRAMHRDATGRVVNGEIIGQAPGMPVWLDQGPDGALYYLVFDFQSPALRRLRSASGATPPVFGTVSASTTAGQAPLAIDFRASATHPSATVSYVWDFGDGTTAVGANVRHVYRSEGTFRARVTATAAGVPARSDDIVVSVGDEIDARIVSPAAGTLLEAGQTLRFEVATSAPDEAVVWDLRLGHDDHAHPVTTHVGRVFTHTIPRTGHDWQGDTSYRVEVRVTGTNGVVATRTLELEPRKTTLRVDSPEGTVAIDGVARTSASPIDTIVGFDHRIETRSTWTVGGGLRLFADWNDGDPARARVVRIPASGSSYTSNYSGPLEPVAAVVHGSLDAQVERLYRALLGRSADADGLGHWKRARAAGMPLDVMAQWFLDLPEFRATYGDVSDDEFVAVLYRNVLDRAPDAEGREFWLGRLRAGATRASIVAAFSESPEFVDSTATMAPESATAASARRLYAAALTRAPDEDGLRFWTDQVARRGLDAVAADFEASAEFRNRYGALDSAGFVDVLYWNVLGRLPDEGGRAYWIDQLRRGVTRGQVLASFAQSSEFVLTTATLR